MNPDMPSSNGLPVRVGTKRKRPLQFLDYFESVPTKKIKSGIPRDDIWKIVFNMRNEVHKCLDIIESMEASGCAIHTPSTTLAESEVLRRVDKHFVMLHIFCEKTHIAIAPENSKGVLFFFCLMAFSLFPSALLFRKEIRVRTFQLFQLLFKFDKEGFYLFFSSLLSESEGKLKLFISRPYYSCNATETKVVFSFCPTYYYHDEFLCHLAQEDSFKRVDGSTSTSFENRSHSLFHTEVKMDNSVTDIGKYNSKALFLYNVISLVEFLLSAEPFWRPSTIWVSQLLDGVYSLLSLSDSHQVVADNTSRKDGVTPLSLPSTSVSLSWRLDKLYAKKCGEVLLMLKRRQLLHIHSLHGPQLFYYIVQCIHMRVIDQSTQSDEEQLDLFHAWEVELLIWMSETLQLISSSCDALLAPVLVHWRKLILHTPGLLKLTVKCMMDIYKLAIRMSTIAKCFAAMQTVHALASIIDSLQDHSHQMECELEKYTRKEKTSTTIFHKKMFEVSLQLNFPLYLQELISETGRSEGCVGMICRLQRDAYAVSCAVLGEFLRTFSAKWVKEITLRISSSLPTPPMQGVDNFSTPAVFTSSDASCSSSLLVPTILSVEYAVSLISSFLCRQAVGDRISLSEMEKVLDIFRRVWSTVESSAESPFPTVTFMRSFTTVCTLLWMDWKYYFVEKSALYYTLLRTFRSCIPHLCIGNYRTEGIFLTNLVDLLIQLMILLQSVDRKVLQKDDPLMDATLAEFSMCLQELLDWSRHSKEKLEVQGMLLIGMSFGLHNQSSRLLLCATPETYWGASRSKWHVLDGVSEAASLRIFLATLNAYLLFVAPYQQLCEAVNRLQCSSSPPSRKRQNLSSSDYYDSRHKWWIFKLLEPLFSTISEVQVHLQFFISGLSQISYPEPQTQFDLEEWISEWSRENRVLSLPSSSSSTPFSSSPPVVINVDAGEEETIHHQMTEGGGAAAEGMASVIKLEEERISSTLTAEDRLINQQTYCCLLQTILNQTHRGLVKILCKGLLWLASTHLPKGNGEDSSATHSALETPSPGASPALSFPSVIGTTRSLLCRAACAAFSFEYIPPLRPPIVQTSLPVSHLEPEHLAPIVKELFFDHVFSDTSYITKYGFGGLAVSLLAKSFPCFSILGLAQEKWGDNWPFSFMPPSFSCTADEHVDGMYKRREEESIERRVERPVTTSSTSSLAAYQLSKIYQDLLMMRCAYCTEWREMVFLSAGIPCHPILETPPVSTILQHKDVEKLLCLCLRIVSGSFFSLSSEDHQMKKKAAALCLPPFLLSSLKEGLRHIAKDALQGCLRTLRWSDADVLQSDPSLITDVLSYLTGLHWRGGRVNDASRRGIVQELLTYALAKVVGTVHQHQFLIPLRLLLAQEDQKVVQIEVFSPLLCGAAVAKLLWLQRNEKEVLSNSTAEKMQEKEALLSVLDESKEVLQGDQRQRVLRRAFFFLLSLQGDHLLERENMLGEEMCYEEEKSGCTEVWYSLLKQIVSLKSTPVLNREAVLGGIDESDDAPSQLSSDLFFIVNMIHKCTNIEAVTLPILSKSYSGYSRARRKWLLALRSLIPFIGEKVSLIMSYVASLLNSFAQDPDLVALVGSVWCRLLQHCSKEYLTADLMPFMLMELLLLEQKCWSNRFGLMVLHDAMSYLLYNDGGPKQSKMCDSSQHSMTTRASNTPPPVGRFLIFGAPFLHLFAKSSRILHFYGLKEDTEKTIESVALSDVIDSCLFLLQKGSSPESKQFLLHSLYHYLRDMSVEHRIRFAAEPSARLLVYVLIKIARDLPDDVVETLLRTIGLIGAISISSLSANIPRFSKDPSTRSSSGGIRAGRRDASPEIGDTVGRNVLSSSLMVEKDEFTFLHFLSWRKLMFVLLNRYIPQALAGTDMLVHLYAAFASQELLRMGIERENNGVPIQGIIHHDKLHKFVWWRELSPGSRQLLEVFASTDYRQRERTKSLLSDDTDLAWHFRFYCTLSDSCSSVRIKKMIAPLRRLVKRFPPLLVWLFPYVVLDALLHPDASEIIMHYFHELYDIRGDVRISDRLQTMLTLFEQLQHARWHFSVYTLRKPSLMDLTPGDCTRLSTVIFSLLHEQSWNDKWNADEVEKEEESDKVPVKHSLSSSTPPLPSWAQRTLASCSIGNSIMAIRFIEAQLRLPSMEDVKTYLGEEVLRGLFRALGDQDALKSLAQGVAVIDPAEAAFIAETNGEWSSAIQNCELVLQQNEHSIPHQVLLLRSLRHLGQLQLASQYAENLRLHHRSMDLSMATRRRLELDACEAAWRLGRWDNLWGLEPDSLSSISSLAFPLSQWVKFVHGEASLSNVYTSCVDQRRKLIPMIRSVSLTDEEQIYRYTSILHGLSDLEYTAAKFHKFVTHENVNNVGDREACTDFILSALQQRLGSTVEDILIAKEPLLSLHRRMAEELPIRTEAATSVMATIMEWHVHLLRNSGYPEAALALAKQPYVNGGRVSFRLCVPIAELLYETGSKVHAVTFVEHSIEQQRHFHTTSDHKSPQDRHANVTSQLQVLLTDWKMEASDQTQDEIIRGYEKAIEMNGSELAHHKLALFYEKIFLSTTVRHTLSGSTVSGAIGQQDQQRYTAALKAIEHFGKALTIGCDTLLVSLPRMLTLWLDTVYELTKKEELHHQEVHKKEVLGRSKRSKEIHQDRSASCVSTIIKSSPFLPSEALNDQVARLVGSQSATPPSSTIPLPYLLTALPQLLSRLGHPHPRVVEIISDIVVPLLQHYPQPCLWQVLPLSFGKPEITAKIVKERILNSFSQTPSHAETRRNAEKIFESLIALCNAPPESFKNGARLTQMSFMKEASRLVQSFEFILPTLYNMTPDVSGKGNDFDDVFPSRKTFKGFDDTVILMKSKQQPKRIQVLSNVGVMVPFLCKADDEPRKDMRMMDLAALINKFLLSDSDARRRGLSLHRYSVAALSSKCAIIEWVKDLAPLYPLVMGCYQCCLLGLDERKIKGLFDEAKEKKVKAIDVLQNQILPHFPPIFHCWFDKQFQTNDDWYQARNLYTNSTALWSMAGHIVGLGDRHGENLLLNQRTGEAMHVDFAEMFDSAEKLPVPEVVRFRLTPNVTDGLGVVGTSGSFQAVCQLSLRCQMKNSNALMSIAETHLYEPSNRCSTFSMQRMSRRLSGYLDFYNPKTSSVFPLSNVALNVEGQVGRLISHSSSLENLAEMYTWWRPWI